MNKESYVKLQQQNLFINNVLLTFDKEDAYKILIEKYGIYNFIDIIDTYLSFPNIEIFLRYFSDINEKLRAILETVIFALNNIEDEELEEDTYDMQIDLIDLINVINTQDSSQEKEEIQKMLLLSRALDFQNIINKKEFLRKCYKFDYDVSLYLNVKNYKLMFSKKEYPFILLSLYHYFNQIIFTSAKEETVIKKINHILSYNYQANGKNQDRIDYYKKLVLNSYKEAKMINFDDYMIDMIDLTDEEKEERNKNISMCTIYDMQEYKQNKTKLLKKNLKGE